MTAEQTTTPGAPVGPFTPTRHRAQRTTLRGVPTEVGDVPIHDHEIRLHGHLVRFLTAGDSGPVVLLLHGLAGDADTWRPVLAELAQSCRVVAPDLLGHGLSAKPRGDYSLGAFASGVRDLMMALGHEHVTVVGHSLGGGVAMQFAYQFPELTERLALISSGGLGHRVSPALRLATLPGASVAIPLGANRFFSPLVENLTNRLLQAGLPLPMLAREAISGYIRMSETPTARAFVTTTRGVIDIWGQRINASDRLYLAALMPTLFVVGDRDTVIPHEHSVRAASLAPGSRLEIIPGAGHVPFWDDPERVSDILVDFVIGTEPARTEPAAVRELLLARAAED